MIKKSINEFFKAIHECYHTASKAIKHIILNEFCTQLGRKNTRMDRGGYSFTFRQQRGRPLCHTVNQADILTTWVESRTVLGKEESPVVNALSSP